MRRLFTLTILITSLMAAFAQAPAEAGAAAVPLDSCRRMALRNNKSLQMSRLDIQKADYQKLEARAAYLPGVDFAGGYTWNQKNISVFDSDQLLPTQTFNPLTGKYEYNLAKNPLTGELLTHDGQYVPETVALMPKEALTYDLHHVFFGAVTITQPIFMGGKIRALNQAAGYARELARELHTRQADEVIYNVDAAYWQVVSLKAKHELAVSYVALLDTLQRNVQAMIDQGVATRADLLSVEVKLNAASIDLTKVENGLVLARMALAQVCGLPVDTVMTLADEGCTEVSLAEVPANSYDMDAVYARRPDLQALATGIKIYQERSKVARSAMMPTLALTGTYLFSNPNTFNGFKKRFNGAFSVGAVLTVPIWHWGGNYYKYKAAEADIAVARLEQERARELVDLQVRQAAYRASEAVKTYESTHTNLAKANENLRQATLGFREGVMTTENVMEAQTAWLKANSEHIDAMIDVKLCDVYLAKALGTLSSSTAI